MAESTRRADRHDLGVAPDQPLPDEEPLVEETGEFAETRSLMKQFGAALRHDSAAAWRRAGNRLKRMRAGRGQRMPRPRFRAAEPSARERPSVWFRVLRGFVLVALAGLLGVLVLTGWALRDIPWQEIAAGTLEPVVVLETADGTELVSHGPYQGAYAELEDFPQHLIDAVLSAEDRRFYDHFGIDFRGILRALLHNIQAGGIVEGGSTITQQLIKITYLERDRTLKRKIQEAVIAVWLEQKLGKDRILTRYLNNIYLGAGATGMPAAARVYFDKAPGELNVAESAMLAGLIRAPSQLNPLENPSAARERAESVLNAMVADDRLQAREAARAKLHFVQVHPNKPAVRSGSWFADWVSEEAREIAGPYRGTIRVRTTLQPKLQAIAEEAVANALDSQGAAAGASQAALVAMRPDGAVVAMVGGRAYDESPFNRAVTARRQPGSAFKLFTYYAALKKGYSLDDRIRDAPVRIGDWEPENFDGRFRGSVTLAEAFARSINAATVALAMEVGIPDVVAAARELGIDAELGETPSVVLGSYGVGLIDLTGAYASVRAGRAPVEPWGIASFRADGQPRAFGVEPPEPETDIAPYQPDLVQLLRGVIERGTGRAATLDTFAAGKTGTSQNFRDAWFIGFTEPLVAGVWVGNDDDSPMNEVTGGRLPAEIWRDFMAAALVELGRAPQPGPAPPTVSDDVPAVSVTGPDGLPLVPDAGSRVRVGDLVPGLAGEPAPLACNVALCSRRYRSFRASDCSFQPYGGGPRELCTAGLDEVPPAAVPRVGVAPATTVFGEPVAGEAAPDGTFASEGLVACNYRACARHYRSFRPSDCTYQPYGGGPRRFCER